MRSVRRPLIDDGSQHWAIEEEPVLGAAGASDAMPSLGVDDADREHSRGRPDRRCDAATAFDLLRFQKLPGRTRPEDMIGTHERNRPRPERWDVTPSET